LALSDSGRSIADSIAREGDKSEHRAARECELAARQSSMPNKCYGVIYADPPWRFAPYSRDTGMDRAADNHYPTMDIGVLPQ
jgi:hypothetical protein